MFYPPVNLPVFVLFQSISPQLQKYEMNKDFEQTGAGNFFMEKPSKKV